MPYFEKSIKSGKLLEVEKYFATRDGVHANRMCWNSESDDDQQESNQKQSWKRLTRLINTNFDGGRGDVFATYTHAEEVTEAEAWKSRRRLLDALRRARKKAGLDDLKYIVITEKQAAWHHHVVMNGGLGFEDLREVWKKAGRVMVSTLDDSYSYESLAKYLTKKDKPSKSKAKEGNAKEARRKYARRWSASRNLKQPEVTKRKIKPVGMREIPKAPKGYRLLPDWVKGADRYGNYYLYYACVLENNSSCTVRRGLGQRPNGERGKAPPLGKCKAKEKAKEKAKAGDTK